MATERKGEGPRGKAEGGRGKGESRLRPSAFPFAVLVAGLLAYVLWFAWQTRLYYIDDAYIGLQYLRNLLAGHGFVFSPGSPAVEGVTNIGWLLLLAPVAAVIEPAVAAKVLGLVLLLVALVLTARLGRELAAKAEGGRGKAEAGLAVVPVVLLAVNFDFLYFSLAGMETALLAVVLLAMASVAVRVPGSLWLPVLGAFAFLVHPEAVVVYPLYSLLVWSRVLRRRRLCVGNLLLAGLVVAVTAIRYWYFQDVLPNTFHSKPSSLLRVLIGGCDFLIGRNVNVPFPITGWLALPVLVLGYLRLRRAMPAAAAMLGAITAVGLAFCIYCPPDWTAMGRYFAPYLPAAMILFWAGMVEVIGRVVGWAAGPSARGVAALGVVVLLVLVGMFDRTAKMARMDAFPGYVLASKNLVEPSLWMRDHCGQRATIATRRIGVLGYFSGLGVFDYTFGLPDREVARLVAAAGGRIDSPAEAALAKLWRARAPDYILEDGQTMDLISSRVGGTRERFSIHGLEYGELKRFSIGRATDWVLAGRIYGSSTSR